MIDWKEISGERWRAYHYADGGLVEFSDVVRIEVRKSGTHRLETKDGLKAFVPPGWRWLEIKADAWTC